MAEITEHEDFYEVRTTVLIPHALHARPCMQIVEVLQHYPNPVLITRREGGVLCPAERSGQSIIDMIIMAEGYDEHIRYLFTRQPYAIQRSDVEKITRNLEHVLSGVN